MTKKPSSMILSRDRPVKNIVESINDAAERVAKTIMMTPPKKLGLSQEKIMKNVIFIYG